MSRKDNIKKSLIMSIALIIVSVAFFVGSTFAWFSDSIKSGNNKIMAGNLDVELYHTNGATKEKVTEETKLFNMALWEPGAMVYESFEVVNEGELALHYEFVMNIAKFNIIEETGKSLKDVLKVAVVEGDFNMTREDIKKLDFRQSINGFIRENTLNLKGATDKFTIIVYWEPSDSDNEYNLNSGKTSSDGEALSIDLGVSLVASQNAYEEDTLGNDYDEIVDVSNSADFLASIKTATDGNIVRLAEDVTVNSSVLEFPKNADVTIDLNNHTLESSSKTTIYVDPGRDVKIKNGVLNLDQTAMNKPTTYVYGNSTLTLENVDYISNTATGIMPYGEGAVINIINCNFKTVGYAISTNANHPEHKPIVNIKNSHIVASDNPDHYLTPILFNVPGQLNIEDSIIEGRMHGVVVRGGTAVIKNSTIINNVTSNELVNKYKDIVWESGTGVPVAALTMGNKASDTTNYNYPTNVTLINTTLKSLNNLYPDVYAYGNLGDGLGVTFNYDEASTVGKITVGNDKVMINGVNATVNE